MPRLRKRSLSQKLSKDRNRKKKTPDVSPKSESGKCQKLAECESDHPQTKEIISQAEVPHILHEESFHGLSADDVMDGELEVQVMDLVTQILKSQFHHRCIHGLLPPSYLYALNMSGGSHPKIPTQSFAVQIHIIPGHYMVSAQMNGRLHVYDSLYNMGHLSALQPQLRLLYEADMITDVRYTCPQTQGYSNLCGFFAIANAYDLLSGDVLEDSFLDVLMMRTHLRNCLINGRLESFPKSRAKKHHSDNRDLLRNYFHSQQTLREIQMKNRKRTQREKLSFVQKELIKENDKIRKTRRKKLLTESEKTELRRVNKLLQQSRRKSMSTEHRNRLKDINRLQQESRRKSLSTEERNRLKDINRLQQKSRRKSFSTEEINRLKDINRLQHESRRKSLSTEERNRLKDINRLQHKSRRKSLSTEERKMLKDSDRVQHKSRRKLLSTEERNRLKDINRLQHESQRKLLSTEKRNKLKDINRLQHESRRKLLSTEKRNKLKDINRLQHESRRKLLSTEKRNKLKDINRLQHESRRKSLSTEDRKRLKDSDRVHHKSRRKSLSTEDRNRLKDSDRIQHKSRRKSLSTEDRNRLKDSDRIQHKSKRKLLSAQEEEILREKNKTRHKKRRKDQANLHASYNTHMSTTHEAVQNVLKTFLQNIQEGPTYVCSVCNRFLYRTSVKHVTEKLINQALGIVTLHTKSKWICITCANSISRKRQHSQAAENSMKITDTPQELKSLSSLEKQLISKVIPFMKILSLPKGAQQGLKGQVVLVPSNVQLTAASLPRNTSEAQIIALNLKRRLSDKSTYCKEYIRPQQVNNAFTCLQRINKHYKDITSNDSWAVCSERQDQQFWKSACINSSEHGFSTDGEHSSDNFNSTAPSDAIVDENTSADDIARNEEITDSEDEIEKEVPADVVEDLNFKRSLNSVTCVYPEQGPSVRSDKILNLAPAEGQIPTSVFYLDDWETLAFPSLFPDGHNTFHHNRSTPISAKKYVNARLLSSDVRFAESPEYTFQCLHWIESLSVNDTITMSLKKTRQADLSVGQLQQPERLQSMLKNEEIFASFKRVRGTPQYWKEMQQDMLAKIRHFGPYTFFLSGSAADFHWPELIQIIARQYGEHFDLDYIENHMDKKSKRNWLARNPVTAARHIDFIFRKVWENVILSGIHPIGQILNYDIRKEMQSRGTAHFHSAVHVQGAPQVDKESDSEVVAFIDAYISCAVPQEDQTLSNLVTSRQIHHHTRTCKKKKNVNCRFHFPKPPASETTISRAPIDEQAKRKIELSRNIISSVMQIIECTENEISLPELLKSAGISEDSYQEALKTSLKKTTVILKRTPSETCVNPYNPIILKALRANMDIQYITDVWACVAYITSYMCKPERSMSELMRNACKEANTVKDKLKSIGSVFLKSREVSQHEAIARLIGLPLKESNTPVMFVPTGYKHQRTRLLKPRALLQNMNEDDTDIYLPNIIEKYAARPANLERICLAEFASSYTSAKFCSEEQEDVDDVEVPNCSRKLITLKDGLGTMRKRNVPLVLRDYPVTKQKDAEKYYHRLLFLYFPWRNEDELEDMESFEKKVQIVLSVIEPTVQRYEPYLQEVQQASEVCESMESSEEEIWDRLAPHVEQDRDQPIENDPDYQLLDTANLSSEQLEAGVDDGDVAVEPRKQRALTTNVDIQPRQKYLAMVRSLNHKQRDIHDHIFTWCRRMSLASSKEEEPDPFYIFLSGGLA